MQPLIQRETNHGTAHVAYTTRHDGDLSPSTVPVEELARRRQLAIAHPWCVARQVHSDRCVRVARCDAQRTRPVADALVTTEPNLVLAVHTGDCVPVGFLSDGGALGVAHAGWKGLEAGVLESTVRRLREIDAAADIVAAVGPHIRAPRYEFAMDDLRRLSQRFGPDVVAETTWGTPALDLSAAIALELERLGVQLGAVSPDCTAERDDLFWSHRARQETGRSALVAWIEQ